MPPVWLIGMMGSGKSTVGRMIAERRGILHIDIDQVVEEEAGRSVAEIFAIDGQEVFRNRSAAAVTSLGESDDVIVSTGGGVVLDPASVSHMRATGVVVMLEASIPNLANRVGTNHGRPLLDASEQVEDQLDSIWASRAALYESARHYVVDANQAITDVVSLVAGFARFVVSDDSYVLAGPMLPGAILPPSEHRQQAVVVAQPGSLHVARAVMARLETEVDAIALYELPDRENAKTLTELGRLYETLGELNVGRHDAIVAVGGGAVTDAAGFAAATWMRGIELALIPTTLLAAVDAAIGGKTGINVGGKNLVGSFWHAGQISVSYGILETLSEELLREGAAEVIKAGFIADPGIVASYEQHGLDAPLGDVVRRAIEVKASIVFDDFRERGRRALLNFGHTIGHGIETHLGMAHGHAVALGMVAAAAISAERHGFDQARVSGPLERLGLPVFAGSADGDAVRSLIARDKKRTKAGLRMVLLRDVGDPVIESVDAAAIGHGLAAIGID